MSSRTASLMQIIDEQKREIDRYRSKLRDLVAAHKSLIKEKEALEESLNALKLQDININPTEGSSPENNAHDRSHVNALVNSITTLSAEKTRMKSSYQADNKSLREEKEAAERKIIDLEQELSHRDVEVDELKSKIIVERHERDKEQADHGAMMKELQSLFAAERSARIKIEEGYNELRKRNAGSGTHQLEKYQKVVESLENELKVTQRKLELAEKRVKEPPRELFKLQDEIRNLQIEHQTAIQQERLRAEEVEDRAKKQALIQEERVINLEAKLAELSTTVGTYDRMRLQDLYEIVKLKEYISTACNQQLKLPIDNKSTEVDETAQQPLNKDENTPEGEVTSEKNVHSVCTEEIARLHRELDFMKSESKARKESSCSSSSFSSQDLIKSLQERIRVLTDEAASKEKKKQNEIEQLKHILRNEKLHFKEAIAAAENDYRGKLNLLEGQLQKLRERSIAMIEDKDQEIHTLQGTFQTFLPGGRPKDRNELPSLTTMRDGPRMLHYANELARRDVDIATLRRAKHKIESALRESQKMTATNAEAFREERQNLLEEIAKLTRCQSREGANMEYLKNVVLNFLVSNDAQSKRHMCNAIAAVLKFSEHEQEKIAKQSHNSWWTVAKT